MPASILAPSACVATEPRLPNAAVVILVVVDLPLVPVTSTVRLPRPSCSMTVGSIFSAINPPIIDPLPRPAFCEAHDAAAAARSASRPRTDMSATPRVYAQRPIAPHRPNVTPVASQSR
jgi:hypothetical protein